MEKSQQNRQGGPLDRFAAGFEKDLKGQGYRSTQQLLGLLTEVSDWLDSRNLSACDLTPACTDVFLSERRAKFPARSLSQRGLQPMLDYLVRVEAVPAQQPVGPRSVIDALLDRYEQYLIAERGLAVPSIRNYTGVARQFLSHADVRSETSLENLTTADVTAFVLSECRRCKTGSAKAMTTRLRSLLRFLYVEGTTPNALSGAVPTVASWRLSSLPKAIAPSFLAALLVSCDRSTATGRRDYAILVVLSRLGLRAGEVAGLQLDHIDWRAGELVICGKGNRKDRLPLPVDVGAAIVEWLQNDRPLCTDRAVFLRMRAPQKALSAGGISAVAWHACDRAGLAHIGAHRLRHTAATQMLQSGASLGEVGQVLRHRDHDTTSIYAKVDRQALGAVVKSWPGGAA